MKPNIIIEGVDRLGKDTLINSLLNKLGYFQVVHYQKPAKLDFYSNDLRAYQEASFNQMFNMLSIGGMLLNRAHLGEVVYSPRYRGYDGSYALELEGEYPAALENSLLVLLTASSWDPITDDGLSFNFDKKSEEQQDFISAFNRSMIRDKLIIDVTTNNQFKPRDEILREVLDAYYILLCR